MMHSQRRIRVLVLVVATWLLAGCEKEGPGAGAGGGFQMPPTPVEVAIAETRTIEDRFRTVGTVRAVESITVVAEVAGVIKSLPFREGDHVRRGAVLAQLEDAELQAAQSRAAAVHEQARNAFERVQRIVAQEAGSAQDLDDAAAALKVAEADEALATARLEKTQIRAAFGGVVGPRRVSAGAYTQPGQPITDLTRLDEIEIWFNAAERYVPLLERGAEVLVSTTAIPGIEVRGTIHVVDPVLDPETRSAAVVARVPNPGEQLRPGMSADVSAILSVRAAALTIPSESVFADGGASFVYVVKPDSTVERAAVQLGTRLASSVEVLGGLEQGARVVRAGHQKLYPGARVMPVQSSPSGATSPDAPPAAGETPAAEGRS